MTDVAIDEPTTPATEEQPEPRFPHALSFLLKNVNARTELTVLVNAGDGSLGATFEPAYLHGFETSDVKPLNGYTQINAKLRDLGDFTTPLEVEFANQILDVTQSDDPAADLKASVEHASEYGHISVVAKAGPGFDPGPFRYATIDLADVGLSIHFLLKQERTTYEPQTRSATLDVIDLLGPWVIDARQKNHVDYDYTHIANGRTTKLRACVTEYERRVLGLHSKKFDVTLSGRDITALPTRWVSMILEQKDKTHLINTIHGRSINYFIQNPGLWDALLDLEETGVLLIDPTMHPVVEGIVEEARRVTRPNYQPPRPMRLGWLAEESSLLCIRANEQAGFEKGKRYDLRVVNRPREPEFVRVDIDNKTSEPIQLRVRRKKLYQLISLRTARGWAQYRDDEIQDVKFLIEHFQLPDPGAAQTHHPEATQANLDILGQIETDTIIPSYRKWVENDKEMTTEEKTLALESFTGLRAFQRNDLAVLGLKESGVLAWEQGLGKTIGGLTAAEMFFRKGAKRQLLIIAPQDLIPQWMEQLNKFFGETAEWIGKPASKLTPDQNARKMLADAHALAKQLKRGKEGIWITHYEALSQTGKRHLQRKTPTFTVWTEERERYIGGHYEDGRWVEGYHEKYVVEFDSDHYCPNCRSSYNGEYCNNLYWIKGDVYEDGISREEYARRRAAGQRRCGYSNYGPDPGDVGSVAGRIHTIASILSCSFRKGVIVVDEATKMTGATSQMSMAIRGFKAKHRITMTGTPIKNFVKQAFWILWWTLGNDSKRFPYKYADGQRKFADDYTVREWTLKPDAVKWNGPKDVAEVTNRSRLWRQLAPSLIRRTKENTGETIPPKKFHVVTAPLGYRQREQLDYWAQHFHELFAEKHPDSRAVRSGAHVHLAPLLGMAQKFDYASVLPCADPDYEWTNVPVSNYTPAVLKTLETVMSLVKQGRKVLVGSDLVATQSFLAGLLEEKGVLVQTLVNGSGTTIAPAKRAKVIREFQHGPVQVLLSTVDAIRLGHDLTKGSAVVLHGLPWDYEMFDQYAARVHRLSSLRCVDIYVTIPQHTIVERKWRILQEKSEGAQTALDGSVLDRETETIDQGQIAKELAERGVPLTGDEVLEEKVEEAWRNVAHIDNFEVPDDFESAQAVVATRDPLARQNDGDLCRNCGAPMGLHDEWEKVSLCPEWAITAIPYEEAFDQLELGPEGIPHAEYFEPPKTWRLVTEEDAARSIGRWLVKHGQRERELEAVCTVFGWLITTKDRADIEEKHTDPAQPTPAPAPAPDGDQLAALMEQMRQMQEQMQALQQKNEELEKQLTEPAQLSLAV